MFEGDSSTMLTSQLCRVLNEFSTAILADARSRLGLPSRIVDSAIRPIVPFSRMVGAAVTIKFQSRSDPKQADLEPYRQLLIHPGDVCAPICVIEVPVEHHCQGVFGEGAAIRARRAEYGGALVDGAVRDTEALRDIDFVVFSRTIAPGYICNDVDIAAIGEPVEIGGVLIQAGDVIVGDNDGVIVIDPTELDLVMKKAGEIKSWENERFAAIRAGRPIDQTQHSVEDDR